jgi:hypothetical protein
MSSTESNSSEPGAPRAAPGPSRGSVALVVVTMALLAALVWALSPRQPAFKPAPVYPHPPGCPKYVREFTPSNYTEVPGVSLDGLSKKQKNSVLLRLNMEPCPCGCNVSVAACLTNHPECAACKELAEEIVAEERGERRGPKAAGSAER